MANKLYAMEQLTEEVAKDVSANPQEWIRFLNTASRLYRYTFPEQLLIYAQRPGATAVASMEIWNQKMYRWIKKGSKGIALIDNTSGPKTKLRYVFDVQDTYKVKNLGRDPQLWNLNPEGEQLVADYLQEQLALVPDLSLEVRSSGCLLSVLPDCRSPSDDCPDGSAVSEC